MTALYVSLLIYGRRIRLRRGEQVTWQALPGETRVQCLPDDNGLIIFFSPPVSGALGVIGISGRVCYKETNQALP